MAAIGEAFKRLEGFGIGLHPRLGFHRQASARRAIEETGRNIDRAGGARLHRLFLIGRHVHSDALRHEILDRKAHFAGWRGQAINLDAGTPFTAGGPARDHEALRHCAGFGIGETGLGGDEAVRAIDHQMTIPARDLTPCPVAQQRGQLNGFAGPVNAAVGIDIGVHRAGRAAPADCVFGEVHRRAVEIKRGEFALRIGGHDQPGGHCAFAAHQRLIERDAA